MKKIAFLIALELPLYFAAAQTQQVDNNSAPPAPIFWNSQTNRLSIGSNALRDTVQLHLSVLDYKTGFPNNGMFISSKWCGSGVIQGHQKSVEFSDPAFLFRITGGLGANCVQDAPLFNIDSYGRVGIGNSIFYANGDDQVGYFNLYVQTGLRTERLYVDWYDRMLWADKVFEKEYSLMPLSQLQRYIRRFKHLPGIPTAKQVQTDGIDLVALNTSLLQKVEELTLYMISAKKRNETLAKRIAELQTLSK